MKYLLIYASFLLPISLTAQQFEIGMLLGASTYQGDISPSSKKTSLNGLHPSLGVFGRYNVNPYLTARASFSYAKISGDDAQSNDEGRQRRNLDFESNVFEFSLIGEINIFGFQAEGLQKRFSPYLFGGIAVFHFNPETTYEGQVIALQPLGTEGQGAVGFPEKYKLTQLAIPIGGGLKIAVSERLNIGIEVGARKTFTDYLDDISTSYVNYNQQLRDNGALSAALGNRTGEYLGTEPIDIPTGTQRGNPNKNDWYLIGGMTISFNLFGNGGGLGGGRNSLGCPKF